MKHYLYNPLANNGIRLDVPGVEMIDATKTDYAAFFGGLPEEDEVVIVGGDGTINNLVNAIDCENLHNKIWLLGNGSGNDFLNDIEKKPGKEVLLNPYLKNLPTVWVNGIKRKYINNMGFGIDGYVCEEADRIKARKPGKKVNYTLIALKGLLYDFKPRHATVEVDGIVREFDNVWLAPAMKGRFYGGGMMIAPGQDRASDKLTVVVYACRSKLRTLLTFPKIFTGRHVEKTDITTVLTGNKIHVSFSRPCAAQIDGDTVLNVTEYRAEL